MIIDIAPRRSGKTTRMISWLLGSKDRILITFSENEKERLRKICEDLKFPEAKDQIMTWFQAQQHIGYLSRREVSIDNLDTILYNQLKAHSIERVSFSEDEN